MTVEPAHYTDPPTDDKRLERYFCHSAADLGFSASFIGPRGGDGAPRTDDKLVNRGIVRLNHEMRGNGTATDHRRTKAILDKLDPRHVLILYLAYGPEGAVPGLLLKDNAPARKKLGTHLGQWRNVLLLTKAVAAAFEQANRHALKKQAEEQEKRAPEMARHMAEAKHAICQAQAAEDVAECTLDDKQARAFRKEARELLASAYEPVMTAGGRITEHDFTRGDLCGWLVNKADVKVIREARAEAAKLVREAWNAWADARGRKVRYTKLERESA